jgi:NAD(P)-dependent dehydrogenase (short-subunit alcohol dehydrogenase family)
LPSSLSLVHLSVMPNALVVGASRGLGLEIAKQYAQQEYSVHATSRSPPPKGAHHDIHWIEGVDIGTEEGGPTIVKGLKGNKLDVVVITAGYFPKESLDEPNFEDELKTYKTCAIGPVFVVHALHKAGLLKSGTKVILVSSEAGSIGLRHESEGGGLYAHRMPAR